MWKDWIRLQKDLAPLGEELPPTELLPAKRQKQSLDPTKRDASKEEFGQRALAGGNMYSMTLSESFDKINPEIGIDSVARQMHQKTVQHYRVKGGGCPSLKDTLIQPMEVALNQTTFLTQTQALLGKAISEHTLW